MKTLFTILFFVSLSFAQLEYSPAFREMSRTGSIASKKQIWRSLTPAEQVQVRRENFAWGASYLRLTEEQVSYLNRLSADLPTITLEQAREYEQEALQLFPKKKAQILFGSIGPYHQEVCSVFVNISLSNMQASCFCSVGSSFNMSCESTCAAGNGACTPTPDGCGFGWLYACGGTCVTGADLPN